MSRLMSRRSAMILPLAAALPGRARAAMPPIVDAAGRTVILKAPAERIVLGFNFEEYTAITGVGGWDRVVGINRRQWGRIPGGWGPMSPEFVLAAAPDFIFITGSSWANLPNAVRTGFDADIDVKSLPIAPPFSRPIVIPVG